MTTRRGKQRNTKYRKLLETLREQLLASTKKYGRFAVEMDSRPQDESRTEMTDSERTAYYLCVFLARRWGALDDVNRALEKLTHNTYGICEACQTAISHKRLDTIPWVRFCRRCQEWNDQLETMKKRHPSLLETPSANETP